MSTVYPANQGESDTTPVADNSSDKALLQRIRDRFDYHVRAWKAIRERGDKDMQAQGQDGPWDIADREARRKAGRPCIHLDQLEQHTNSLVNEVRQNPIAIKVNPGGNGASPENATLRGDRIRQIEYESNATQAYITAFENAAQRGYGVFGVITEEMDWDSFDQRIKIRRFPNPNTVSWDPDCREADFSDMTDAFVWNRHLIEDFKRDYGDKASITNFGIAEMALAPNWVDKNSVQVAEYWCFEKKERTIYLLDDGSSTGKKEFSDEMPKGTKRTKTLVTYPDGSSLPVLKTKKAVERTLMQYLTNGVEILDRTTWLGKWIPIFPVVGKVKFVRTSGNQTEMVMESYIRKAIDGQMLWDYYKTNEAEVVGLAPKVTYIGYEGQFATNTPWATINKEPIAYGEVKARTDESGELLPLPQRQPYEPPIQALEIGAESARRAIQAAVGNYGFNKLDDTNVKSNVALKTLQAQGQMGSFHFIDNFKCSIRHAGRAINDLLDKIEVGPRDVGIRELDGTHKVVHINEPYRDDNGEIKELRYSDSPNAAFDVVISTGKPYDTLREQAKDFNKNLVGSGLPGVERVLDLMIKLEDLGPYGDEMAERLTPPEYKQDKEGPKIPPEVAEEIQLLEKAFQEAQQQLEEYKAQIPKIEAEKEMKAAEIDSKERIEAEKLRVELIKVQLQNESKEAIALLQAQVEAITNQLDVLAAGASQDGKQEHEINLTRMSQDHESSESAEDRRLAAEQGERDAKLKEKQINKPGAKK